MKLFFPLFLAAIILAAPAFSQSIDLASEIGNSDSEPPAKTDRPENKIEIQKDQKEVADDRGIFSFLNFSFIKKPLSFMNSAENNQTAEAGAPRPIAETPLQKMTRAADNGNVNAQLSLGYMYLYGENGVEADFSKAFKYYEMAAAQNDKIALNNLGSLYFNGIGTEVNYLKAAQLFAKAAQNGSDDAAVNLAFIYLSGNNKNKNLSGAIELFKQAANAGNNTAKFMLGYAYYRGFQVPRDYYKAVALMKEASAAQFDEAQYILALMYMNGQGIAKNYGNTVKNLQAALRQGNISATVELANILTKGTMYPKNLIEAHILYNIAAVYGAPGTAEARDGLEGSLKIDELLQAQAQAEKFQPKPSELTTYIRQTFGNNVRRYIDDNIN